MFFYKLKRKWKSSKQTEWSKKHKRFDWLYFYTEVFFLLQSTLWYPIENFVENIQRVLRWFPIIWKDRDYDYSNIFKILAFKIKQNRLCILAGYGTNREKTAKKMFIVEQLLKRLYEEKYDETPDWDEYWNKWGASFLLKKQKEGKDIVEVLTVPDKEKQKMWKILNKKEKYMREQDLELLWKIIKNNHQKWWD